MPAPAADPRTPDVRIARRTCPACGGAELASPEVVPGKLDFDKQPLTLVACRACGCRFQAHSPTLRALAQHYDYMGHVELNVEMTPLLRARLRRMLGRLGRPSPGARLLEIGCGGGLVVRVAEELGWQVWGTEISPSCVALMKPRMGERLFQGGLPDAPFAAESFDAAMLIEVIEHLEEPAAYLASMRRLLKPGGRLLLSTPNARGATARTAGYRWRVFADEHLNYFDPRSMRTLLERNGFVVERLLTSNIDVAPLIWGLRRGLARLRPWRAVEGSATPMAATASVDGTPHPSGAAAEPAALSLRARVSDVAIEALNRVTEQLGIGDSLKVLARRR